MIRFSTLLLALLMLTASQSSGQFLSVFDLDESAFPTVRAKMYAFDATGGQMSPTPAEMILTENGVRRNILSVTCPPIQPPRALSSVLVVDVSGSMAEGPAGTANIDLARSAARAWVNTLPLGESECALTSFDNFNYLNQDFTIDRSKLLNAINGLTPKGATDYDMGLLLPVAGGLQITRNGKHQKVIVFLTDGVPSKAPDVAAIIAEAQRQNCIIYAVTLNMICPQTLRDISTQTGGNWFENVTSIARAEEIYRQILMEARSGSPCEIVWESARCPAGYREVDLEWSSKIAEEAYIVPTGVAVSLDFSPVSVFARSKPIAVPFDTVITVTAGNSAFNVTNITSSNPAYDINPKSFSLPQGGSTNLTVTYTPPDSGYTWTEFRFETDVCDQFFYVSGGYPGVAAKGISLKVDHPNGGETFVVNSDTVITWSGIPASDWVRLEYSTNNGLTWRVVEPKTRGGSYNWHVPNTPSTRCLVRATRLENEGDAGGLLHTLQPHGHDVMSIAWNPDGTRVATASVDQNARIWDASSGTLIGTLSGHGSAVLDVKWSPDGTQVATASADRTVKVWNAATGALNRTLTGHTSNVIWLRWSPDGTRIATASQDQTSRIWDVASGTLLHTLSGHTGAVYDAKWSPDGTRVITTSGDASAKIWDAGTGALIHTLSGHTDFVMSASWSPDGTQVVTASQDYTARIWDAGTGAHIRTLTGHTFGVVGVEWNQEGSLIATASRDGTARIWDATTGASLHTLTGHGDWVIGVRWSPDGSMVATASFDDNAKVWKASSGQLLQTLSGHTDNIYLIEWSPEGNRLATAGYDQAGRIWHVQATPTQEDVSDAIFSIIKPTMDATNVDMGKVLIGTSKDSVVAALISNPNSLPVRVDSIKIQGVGASLFTMVSGVPPFIIPANGTASVEFNFRPTTAVRRIPQLLIYTADTLLSKTIEGEGIAPQLEVVNQVIDFGQVNVGIDKDSLQAVTIRNVGTAPLDITGTRHAEPNDVDFSTLAGAGPFTLAPGETARMNLRFTPVTRGRTSGTLLFDYNGDGSPAVVQLLGEGISTQASPVIVNNAINFGKVRIGSQKDSLQAVTIANLSTEPITITNARHSGPNIIDFTTLAGGGAFVLQPGDTAKLDLRFTPSAVGSTSGSLLFEFDGVDSPLLVRLLGEGIDVSSATIRVEKAEAMPGDTIEVPVLLEDALNLDLSGATAFTAQLRFNATLLEPIAPTPGGTIVGEDRVIDLQLPTTADGEGVLMKLNFRAGLGNDSLTTLLLENATAVGGTVAMTVEAGEFRLLGICAEGGARLLNPNGNVILKLVSENPVLNGSTEIELETIEIGRTSLVLHNMAGSRVATFIDGEVEPGRRIVRLDLTDLSAGLYYLKLQTPTETRTIPLQLAQ